MQNVNVTHVTNINVVNVTNVTNVRYVNQNVQGAVTAVPQQSFVSARPVAQAAVVVPPGAMAQAQVTGTTAAMAPQRQSVLCHPGQPGTAAAPPARFAERPVVAKSAPPPPPVSFAAKQQALQGNAGRPLEPSQMENIRREPVVPPRNDRPANMERPVNTERYANAERPNQERKMETAEKKQGKKAEKKEERKEKQ